MQHFFAQEEGRIRKKVSTLNTQPSTDYWFDYFLKDHLGNIRMVLTDEHVQNIYPAATLEDGATALEKKFYDIVDGNIKPSPTGIQAYPNKNGGSNALDPPVNPNPASHVAANSQKMYRLNAANGSKTGLGISMHVMAGDEIAIQGRSYYNIDNANDNNNYNLPITSLLSALLSASGGVIPSSIHSSVSVTDLNSFTGNDVGTFLTNGNRLPTTSSIPRAYINYIFFDEHLKYVSGGISSVGQKGATKNYYVDDPTLQNIAVPKNGYLYVYCSNESPVDVFFDNLQVINNKRPLTEETHYYPFGLTMGGISSNAVSTTHNKYQYSGKEIQNKEFSDGSGLETYDFHARMQDPQLGRFMQIDPKCEIFYHYNPYNYCFNNPMLFVDPDGMLAQYNWEGPNQGQYTDNGEVVSWDQVQQQHGIGGYSTNTSVLLVPNYTDATKKTVKHDSHDALKQDIELAKKYGQITILNVENTKDAASQMEGLHKKIKNLFIDSHGDPHDGDGTHQAYFAIGGDIFHTSDINSSSKQSNALSRIAATLASTPGPLPSAAQVVVLACGAGGTYNSGVEMLKALAKKLNATVYGNQSLCGPLLFNGSSLSFTKANWDYKGHNPNNGFSGAFNNTGNWTRAYNNGASQTITNVYFDAFGKIHYTQ